MEVGRGNRGEEGPVRGPERVTVPAGTFEALRVEYWITLPASPDPVLVKTAWYAQGVGLVKCTGEIPHGDGVLRSFIFKGLHLPIWRHC